MSDILSTQVTAEIVVATVPPDAPNTADAPVAATAVASAPTSIRQSVIRSAWRDLRKFMTVFFAATTVLLSYHLVRLSYGDVRDYFAYVGTVGPLTVVEDVAGSPAPGKLETVFHASERVGWTSKFCANPGHPYSAFVSLVQVGSGGVHDVAVVSRVKTFSGDAERCGPLFAFLTLPADTAPGAYRLHRYGVFREGSWWPLRFDFPDVPFTVVSPSTSGSTDFP